MDIQEIKETPIWQLHPIGNELEARGLAAGSGASRGDARVFALPAHLGKLYVPRDPGNVGEIRC